MNNRREELRVTLAEAVMERIDGSKELSDAELRELIEQRIREVSATRRITAKERVVAKRDVFNAEQKNRKTIPYVCNIQIIIGKFK